MSMKPMKPMGGNKGQVTVDLAQAENIQCEKCGNTEFFSKEDISTNVTYWTRGYCACTSI